MARRKLYTWKVCMLTKAGYGLWTYVQAADEEAAVGLLEYQYPHDDLVTIECIDQAWFTGESLSERLAV